MDDTISTTSTILTTDLSLDRDPDDWVDTVLFLTTPGLNPKGLILEHYATDDVETETRRLLRYLGLSNLEIKRGIQQKLSWEKGVLQASRYRDGAEYILDAMRRAPGNVRLIVVGSLRNEALAYQMDPDLFLKKVERLYFSGGNLTARRECNVSRDEIAADIIVNAPIPKVWVPASEEFKQKLSGADEARIATLNHPAAQLVTEMLARWRAAKDEAWLHSTQQLPDQGKNLWSIPAFLHAAGHGGDTLSFSKGKMRFDGERQMGFDEGEDGPDLMLREINKAKVITWVLEMFQKLDGLDLDIPKTL